MKHERFDPTVFVATGPRTAVLLPCKDEEAAIGATVAAFRAALPDAVVYVFDNGSTDRTAEAARAAGAVVRTEPRPGKGNVVRRMFADVEADIYVLADGDLTYDAAAAPAMIEKLRAERLDMVVGTRRHSDAAAYRPGHRLGNRLLTGLVQRIFGRRFEDMLSGYRIFSRRFVKTFPAMSHGFEIETELTIHALQMRVPAGEVATEYAARPKNSASKLSTYRDAIRILRTIGLLAKEEKPMEVFGALTLALGLPSVALFLSVFLEFLRTGLVERFPTLIVSVGGLGLAVMCFGCALILDSLARSRREARYALYLQHPAPQ
ncbi:glycosyltransferase family 2 protein [Jannaschia seohaensis]|uniref:Glycosyltransferase involved in cell wall biosynthesis n=1 Tax=Jannaschia seohaensis TaxID=475081 RepID=A0A2Y9B121_9RHOB|nr:glycosyltransferase family 2 protein [Jannaschia seohaensis]PWJ16175.1 glycosyltransferase involved in cell wall biosynthesis [Jannaschia seohaensis]SSA49178.1 Glycosyltransferase involved in cell wall bisynthesis [Jannaschia seohaensis]